MKEKWGELTDDEIDQITGKRYILLGDRTRGSRKVSQGL